MEQASKVEAMEAEGVKAPAAVRPLSGWGLVALSFTNVAVAYAVVFSFPVFLPVLVEEFRASRGTVAAAFSWAMFIIGVSAVIVGPALDRWGPRRVFCAGALALAGGMAVSALAPSVWMLYLGYGIGGGAGARLLGWVAHGALLGRAKLSRPTTAIAIAFGGMGAGPLIMSPVVQRLIVALGWRWAMAIIGAAASGVVVALNVGFHAPGPIDGGPGHGVGPGGRPGQLAGLGAALRTWHFWLYFLAFLTIGNGMFSVLAHQVAYLVDRGFTPLFAASAFGVSQVLSAPGRVIFGVVADRLGRPGALATSFAMSIAGIGCLLLVRDLSTVWFVYAFVAAFGLSFGARGPILTGMTAGHFGGPTFGTIYGAISLAHGLGTALGPWAAGALFDRTGDYGLTFGLSMLSLGVACATTLTLTRLQRPSRIPS
jgi:MFS family permease